jgi:tetratricopeptide (TPR) repeat protein
MAKKLSAEELFSEGQQFYEQGDYARALERVERAHIEAPSNATYRSYYGLCIGLAGHDFERASELCRAAAKQEFFNPEQYLNLARVYLAFGFKSEGVRYLRRGQMIDPSHSGISRTLSGLGDRGQPVLAFLPRQHFVNRWLGYARHAVQPGEITQAAA